jgi:hypothetical protein
MHFLALPRPGLGNIQLDSGSPALVMIMNDCMWEKLPSVHEAVYQEPIIEESPNSAKRSQLTQERI